MKKHLSIAGFLLVVCSCFAQQETTDSVFRLPAVLKVADRLQAFGGSKTAFHLDSIDGHFSTTGHLADRLAVLPVFIKSYGAGSLATISMRGMGAGHTAVVWEGFNLQSPMNGVVDLSLIPSVLFDDITMQLGGSSALFGSGAVGGSFHLNNTSQFGAGTSVLAGTSFSSFSDFQQWLGVSLSEKVWSFRIKAFNHHSKNNFKYQNPVLPGQPVLRLSNAEVLQRSLLSSFAVRPAKNHKIGLNFWYHFGNRQIPPSLTESESSARQKDESARATVFWEFIKGNTRFSFRSGYFNEFIRFTDPGIDLAANNRSETLISEGEATLFIKNNHRLNFGVNHNFINAKTDNYPGAISQNRIALFSSYRYRNANERLAVTIAIREEVVRGAPAPFTFSLGLDTRLKQGFRLKGNFAKTYRVPTFNDLYWIPGGNPDLSPESGWSMDAGLEFHRQSNAVEWSVASTVFNNQINDWIQWLPNGQGIWRPDNVLSVWSRGLEHEAVVSFAVKQFRIRITGHYALVVSTNTKVGAQQESALNKQLIYVPRHNARGSFTAGFKGFNLRYLHQYTSKRFVTSDNANTLDGFHSGALDLSKSFITGPHKWLVDLKINNIWDADFETIAFRPMPGRHLQFSITYFFQNKPDDE